MLRRLLLLAAASLLAVCACAQSPGQSQAPPRSDDRTPGESSSKDTRIDLSPPAGDAKMHPNSGVADDVLEMHPYDPHKAEKNIEVGDYYYKMKNYRAAESRYQEALEYKPNDAEATYKLGVSQEIQGKTEEALDAYQGYLKILPDGPHAEEAKTAISESRILMRLNRSLSRRRKRRKKRRVSKGLRCGDETSPPLPARRRRYERPALRKALALFLDEGAARGVYGDSKLRVIPAVTVDDMPYQPIFIAPLQNEDDRLLGIFLHQGRAAVFLRFIERLVRVDLEELHVEYARR